ncbi:MAG: MerR family transcriptional regulator [Yoonia sp.]
MRIAQAAVQSGLSQDTIRFYEKSGMLPDIARDAKGWHDFGGDSLTWLITLGHLRNTGMPLDDVKRFAVSAHAPDSDSIAQSQMRLDLLRPHEARLARKRADLDACERYPAHKIGIYTDILGETS